MTNFEEVMSRIIAVTVVSICIGVCVWGVVLFMLWLQRLVLS